MLIAIGIDWEGPRNVLAVELANRESATSWKSFLVELRSRGLRGVQLAISDDHPGLKPCYPGSSARSHLAALPASFNGPRNPVRRGI